MSVHTELAVITGFESAIPVLSGTQLSGGRGGGEGVTRPKKRSALFGNETRDKMSDKIEIRVSNWVRR